MAHKLIALSCMILLLGGVDDAHATSKRLAECKKDASFCFRIKMQVANASHRGLKRFLKRQLAHANTHFAKIGVNFVADTAKRLPPIERHLKTRDDRNRLVRRVKRDGTIHLFIVDRLDNVDAPGEIRGVHWRFRKNQRRRGIILARKASTWVLTHELGHFFGLPHSKYDISLMNKRRRATPVSKRTFAPEELKRMTVRRDRMLKSGMLKHKPVR